MTVKQTIIRTINSIRVHAGALLWNLVAFFSDTIIVLFYRATPIENKVLIIRLDAIGDFILWIEAAKALRQLYPKDKYHLVLAGNELWTPVAIDLNIFDEIIPINTKRFVRSIAYRFAMQKRIRQSGFSVAVQPTFSRLFAFGDSVVRISGAKQKIGFSGDDSVELNAWKIISNRWYSQLIAADTKPMKELERNAGFLQKLGLKDFRASMPQLQPTGDLPEELKEKKYYVVFPGAAVGRRQWSTTNFSELINRIFKSTGWTAVLSGSKSEQVLSELISQNVQSSLIDLTGKTSLAEMMKIISQAQLVIANETSAVHIATVVGTKSICVLGGGHYGRFIPYPDYINNEKHLSFYVNYPMHCYGCDWKCIYQISKKRPAPCVSNITVESVWNKIVPNIS